MAQVVVWSKEDRNEIPVKTCRLGTVVYDWFPDGKSFLITEPNSTGRREIWQLLLLDSTTAKPTVQKLISDPDRDIYHFSGDGRWIVFEATRSLQRSDSTLYAMPAMGGPWVQITDGNQWDDKPRWSPDGRTIYYLSERKGFFNLWGIRFDPAKGQPQGKPFQVASFDSPSPMIPKFIQAVEFSLTDGRLVLPLEQTSGSIWVLDNVDR